MECYYFLICWKQNLNFKLCVSLDYADNKRTSQVQFQVQKLADTFMEFVLEDLGQRQLKTIIVIIRECGVEEMVYKAGRWNHKCADLYQFYFINKKLYFIKNKKFNHWLAQMSSHTGIEFDNSIKLILEL